jgi:outer membrane protein assembly factor BamB
MYAPQPCCHPAHTNVYALDPATGGQRWRTEVPGAVEGRLVVGGPALASGVGRATGVTRWRAYSSDALTAGPMSGLLYVTGQDFLFALDPTTGALRWSAYDRDALPGVAVTGGGAVFVAANYGVGSSGDFLAGALYAFDAPGSG